MSKEKIQIRYDGRELAEHSMDVSILGPSLTALGDLISHGNQILNGENIRVQVKLHADIKANCVTLALDVHWESVCQQIKGLLDSTDVKNAKELLEWLGLIGTNPISVISTILFLLKKKKNNEFVIVKRNGDRIELSVKGGEEKRILHERMYQAALSQVIQEDLRDTLKPLLTDGIEEATFIHKNVENRFNANDAQNMQIAATEELDPEVEEQDIRGHIVIHAPIFEEGSKHWKFKWNGRVESIDVSGTSIPETILKRGRVTVGDAFKVEMKMSEKKTKRGYKQKFRIIKVIAFVPNEYEQTELIWEADGSFGE